MPNERYNIIVSGKRLIFTKDQIESDPGNYFATYFFGDFAEGAEGRREIIIEKDSQLFKLIQAHLRGYEILPLAETAIPWYMTREGALANLLLEAQFYALDMLAAKIGRAQEDLRDEALENADSRNSKYRLATRGTGAWTTQRLSEEIYKFHLNRFSNLQKVSVFALPNSPETGYTVQVAWLEYLADGMPGYKENMCALLIRDI